ncbi:MAG: succinate dehydrogenase cytochrome b558 subunit [Parachlamydiaceae bacterium]|nr:succinate dehydrogenase cytochrome b558 subunit [Parachlamydiaceae bacterium]
MKKSNYQAPLIPSAFIWRKLHSFTGLWLVLFLIEHLLTNSQAALLIGDNGNGFVRGVNFLRNLPYLPVIEIFLLGVPFLIHGIWGIKYLMTSQSNSFPSDGSTPSLTEYPRNHAYTWQRITSWILLFGIIAHVVHMRFIEYPNSAQKGTQIDYMVPIMEDRGLATLSKRINFNILDSQQIDSFKNPNETMINLSETPKENLSAEQLITLQSNKEEQNWIKALKKRPLQEGQVMAVTPDFGVAELLMVRDTFKSPLMIFLYTVLVLTACYHGFNGLWTFMIGWGITLTARSQQLMRTFATGLMILITFLGLAAIWGTYWINLTY